MEVKKLSRRELFERLARILAVGSIAAVVVKLSLNKSENNGDNYPCLEKSCLECALFKNCDFGKAKSQRQV